MEYLNQISSERKQGIMTRVNSRFEFQNNKLITFYGEIIAWSTVVANRGLIRGDEYQCFLSILWEHVLAEIWKLNTQLNLTSAAKWENQCDLGYQNILCIMSHMPNNKNCQSICFSLTEK